MVACVLLFSKAASAMIEIPIHKRTLTSEADREKFIKRAPRTFPKISAPRKLVSDIENAGEASDDTIMSYEMTNV